MSSLPHSPPPPPARECSDVLNALVIAVVPFVEIDFLLLARGPGLMVGGFACRESDLCVFFFARLLSSYP